MKPKQAKLRRAISSEIRELAETFVELQERRHVADYDLTDRFKWSNVLLLINLVERRVRAFTELASSDEKHFFLACLWAWKELANR
jgi:hypothetical protein